MAKTDLMDSSAITWLTQNSQPVQLISIFHQADQDEAFKLDIFIYFSCVRVKSNSTFCVEVSSQKYN